MGMQKTVGVICSEKPVEVKFLRSITFVMVQYDQERRKRQWKEKEAQIKEEALVQ